MTCLYLLFQATANLDFETDQLIRNFLRQQLKDCTTLTIAHRKILFVDRCMHA